MPQPHEFDGEAIFDVPDNTALRLADSDDDADWRPQCRRDADRRTRLQQVNHTARDIGAIWQDQTSHRIAWRKAAVTAVFRKVEDLPVRKPGELCRQLVALSQRRRNRHRKPIFKGARDLALEASKMVDVGDYSFRALFDYWNRQRGERPAPARSDIDPAAIRHALGDTFMLATDFIDEIRLRLAGTRVCAFLGGRSKALRAKAR